MQSNPAAREDALASALPDPTLRQRIGLAFTRLDVRRRVQVLRRLLVPVGPMALKVIAGGVFARYVRQARSPRMMLAVDDVAKITSAQILDLARYAEQCKPSALQQALNISKRGQSIVLS